MSRVESSRGAATRGRARKRTQDAAAPAGRWLLLDTLALVLVAGATFVSIAVFYPPFTKPAGENIHGALQLVFGIGMYILPVVLYMLPAAVLPHHLRSASARGLAWAVSIALLASLFGGLAPDSGWGGIIGDSCRRAGYEYMGQFYPVLLLFLALIVFARLAGRSVVLPAGRWLYRGAKQLSAKARAELAEQQRKAHEVDDKRRARRAEVLAAELAAADAPENDSPVIRATDAKNGKRSKAAAIPPPAAPAAAEQPANAVLPIAPSEGPSAAVLPPDAPLPAVELIVPERKPDSDGFSAAVDAAGRDAWLPDRARTDGPGASSARIGAEELQGQLTLFASTQAGYELPPLALLRDAPLVTGEEQYLEHRSKVIERTLNSFNVEAACTGHVIGPRVTRYELKIGPGINVSRIHNLSDNLALELAVKAVRIEAPIPGLSAVGIEVPNAAPQLITLKVILESQLYQHSNHPLTVCLGRDIAGSPVIANLAKMPHVLVAGATGSGKSVCLNALIVSLLYRNAPDTLRLILIDPKRVEMTNYADLPHLACPVVHDVGQAKSALKWAVAEMERRYRILESRRARNIAAYNEMVAPEEQLPFIVIVVDELADLMMLAGQEIEKLICRIAQLSRAVGIHLVIATQRPDVKVITGTIKANIPSRVAFAVVSQIDSRTILDGGGAEKLLGSGDMLFSPIGENVPLRVQGCFLSDDEIDRVVEWCRNQAGAHYDEAITRFQFEEGEDGPGGGGEGRDEMFDEARAIVQQTGRASTSYLQRRLKVGYNRAARIMEELEEAGIVSEPDAQGSRKVL